MSRLKGLFLLFVCVAGACARESAQEPELRRDMRDAYRQTRELYGYVWSPKIFSAPSSEKRISELLENLSRDFHRAELDAPIEAFEPGFRVTLLAQKNLLADASGRFREGNKDYANWKLRGMAANCISCHSRYQAPLDFVGELPATDEKTPENLLSQGEFLFATRQFDEASESLFHTAAYLGKVKSGWAYQFQALKLWLVIEVRAKNRPSKSAAMLEEYLQKSEIPAHYLPTLKRWIADLKALEKAPLPADPLAEAEKLLRALTPEATLEQDELQLVATLRATTLLHEILQGSPAVDARRKGTYLLGRAYYHLPLPIFEPFEEQYLEITIRDFPHTQEAHQAFKLYDNKMRRGGGMSGGELAEDQRRQLAELARLASPESGSAIGDYVTPP